MISAVIPEELSAQSYCPFCGGHLVAIKSADPWAVCLACESNHRIFIMPAQPLAVHTAKAASANFPQIRNFSPEGIASFWLSDPHARSLLNEQLAILLRAMLDRRSVPSELRFSFCPICAKALAEYDQPDVWVQGLCCKSGHTWAHRGGCLSANKNLALHSEPHDALMSQQIGFLVKGDTRLKSNLHDSVRQALMSSPLCPRNAIELKD
jgi:hypothetical protein